MGCKHGVGTRLILHAITLVAVLLMASTTARAQSFDAADTLAAIEQASDATGIAYGWLYRVVGCETGHTYDPYAIGDHGTSFGAAQLHRGGLLGTFYRVGYDDPYDPYQSVQFMAEQFAAGRSTAWSCR